MPRPPLEVIFAGKRANLTCFTGDASSMWLARAKNRSTRLLGSLLRRHVVLLPEAAREGKSLLPVRAPYRIEAEQLHMELEAPVEGELAASLWGYIGHFPHKLLWQAEPTRYPGPSVFTHDVVSGDVSLGERKLGRAPALAGRRFCWKFELLTASNILSRMTGHYLPGKDSSISESYYAGENYVDHEAQSSGEHEEVLRLLGEFGARGPMLEIGCATGGLLQRLLAAGHAVAGVDVSEWAIEQARKRVAAPVAALNFEEQPLPGELERAGPFHTFILWAVLEHFRQPFAVLRRIAAIAPPGAHLLINTSNAGSLAHAIFRGDWEGYFDWTHHGVDQVSVASLRRELEGDWAIEKLTTDQVWDTSADPSHATVREWWSADARFRRLLVERDLGDFITCVAVKR